jgi:hypothetical protein
MMGVVLPWLRAFGWITAAALNEALIFIRDREWDQFEFDLA